MIELDPAYMTEEAIIRQTKEFGYDPTINNPRNFLELFDDLCDNVNFRRWLIEISNESEARAAHRIMGEITPVWSRRFHILLSVILAGRW